MRKIFLFIIVILLISCSMAKQTGENKGINYPLLTPGSGSRIADHTVINRIRQGTLPVSAIQEAKNKLHIAYGHTSHGSQIISGMNGLVDFANGLGCNGAYSSNPNLFSWSQDGSGGSLHLHEGDGYDAKSPLTELLLDCGYSSWVSETEEFLGAPDSSGRGSKHPDINVIMWSWCGQASGYGEQTMIDNYLTPMSQFEARFPGVIFVYMTCHLNTSDAATETNLLLRDEQIRTFCVNNNKWLLDFSDIETYDPDGTSYAGRHPNDACNYDYNGNGITEQDPNTTEVINGDRNWAVEWQNSHTLNTDWYDSGAAHSQSVNANMKAYAVWWLWSKLAGWDGN